jgi:hypothetical protein
VRPASTQECVLAVPMTDRAWVEAIDWNVDSRSNLSVLRAAEGYVIAASQLLAGDLQW